MDEELSTDHHRDTITHATTSPSQTHLLTVGVDHRINVFTLSKSNDESGLAYGALTTRTLLDKYTAHLASITSSVWFPSIQSQEIHVPRFATLSHDLTAKVWQEDCSKPPMSGRRFKNIWKIKNNLPVPFVGIDVKITSDNSTFLLIIDRIGNLRSYKSGKTDKFDQWDLIEAFNVMSDDPRQWPGRSEHTNFRVRFDKNVSPLPYLKNLSDDLNQLGCVISSSKSIKVYRVGQVDDIIPQHAFHALGGRSFHRTSISQMGHGQKLRFFEVLDVTPDIAPSASIRDVDWAPGNIRGYDTITIADSDGAVSTFKILVRKKDYYTRNAIPSHLSTGHEDIPRSSHPFPYVHTACLRYKVEDAHIDCWKAEWDALGQTLATVGSEGIIKIWREVANRDGIECIAEQEAETDDEAGST